MARRNTTTRTRARKLPGTYREFIRKFPALHETHQAIARAVDQVGPLDAKTCQLIKIGICVGGTPDA
jgi:hypothetical protein